MQRRERVLVGQLCLCRSESTWCALRLFRLCAHQKNHSWSLRVVCDISCAGAWSQCNVQLEMREHRSSPIWQLAAVRLSRRTLNANAKRASRDVFSSMLTSNSFNLILFIEGCAAVSLPVGSPLHIAVDWEQTLGGDQSTYSLVSEMEDAHRASLCNHFGPMHPDLSASKSLSPRIIQPVVTYLRDPALKSSSSPQQYFCSEVI
jgi:hypothetical protein